MNLSQLAAYAESKYRIKEEFKWADFPGVSVLNDPLTGKWAALLMRRWDGELGDEIELCDIKCGRQVLRETNAPYLSVPFRMKGVKWVGVRFDDTTVPDMVYRLFDRAIEEGRRDAGVRSDSAGGGLKGRNGRGASLIELEHLKGLKGLSEGGKTYVDTVLPPPRENRDVPGKAPAKEHRSAYEKKPAEGVSSAFIKIPARENRDVPGRSCRKSWLDEIPEKIWEMMRLYRQGDGTIENRSRNFYIQGKFMEDYEDDAPWNGEFSRFFTTYHDLNVNVLRGYFTWRAHVRKGEYRRITTSLAYLYLYELINGIGGSGDFARSARLVVFSTVSVAKGGAISSVVPMCAHVDHVEHDVHVVVTEQGMADLRCLSAKERAEKIIECCCHPDYRPMLRAYYEQAKKVSFGQNIPLDLENALSWHRRYQLTGSMKEN